MKMRFEWDSVKAASNWVKHKVSFETAARVFADPLLRSAQDRFEHGEARWQSVGMADGHLLLLA